VVEAAQWADVHGKSLAHGPGTVVASNIRMSSTTKRHAKAARRRKTKRDAPRPQTIGELESVTIDDLNERAERARRKGLSGE
jgi:hypothetical protein